MPLSFSSILPRLIKVCMLILISIVSAVSDTAAARDADLQTVAQKLQNTYETATNLVAEFDQTTTMKFSSRVRQGSGRLVFHKPGKMRWDYLTPDHQVLISDGETISMYFEKNRQMIITEAREYLQSDVTYSFFAGTGNILEDFTVSEPDIFNQDENLYLIKMTPKTVHPHVSAIHLWITPETFLITRMQITDHFDTITDLLFSNIQIDAEFYGSRKIDNDLFQFSPPPGTEIIKQF